MNLSRYYVIMLTSVLFFACTKNAQESKIIVDQTINHLIDVDNLDMIIDHDTVTIIDIRKPSEYLKGHIKGSVNVWRPDIENDTLPYGGMIASRGKIEKLFGELGINNSDYIVIYDNKTSCDAFRLWWILEYYGFMNTAILEGGLNGWEKDHSISKQVKKRDQTTFKLHNQIIANRYITIEELSNSYKDSSLVIIDTRTSEEYSGKRLKNGAFDQGRIPGSIHIDWANTINYEEGTLKGLEEIKTIYNAKGIDSTSNVVVYCHSGVRSSHTTFVLTEILGYKNVRNFDGSWIEWSYHKMALQRDSK